MASIYGSVSATGWRLRLDYDISQDREENRSVLSMALYIYDGTGLSYNQAAQGCRYELQGSSVWHPYRYESKGWYQLGTSSCAVVHETDGSGSVTLKAAWYSGFDSQWTPGSLTLQQTVTLPTILRAAQLSCPELTLGQEGVLWAREREAGLKHELRYQIGSASGVVCEKTEQERICWTPPLELAAQLPDAVTGQGTLTAISYDGETELGRSSCALRLYVPETLRPTAQLSVTVVNDDEVPAGWGVCLMGHSRLRYQVVAAGAYGSSINSCQVQLGGQKMAGLTGTSAMLEQAGTLTVRAEVTDSRGRRVTAEATPVEVLPYSGPGLSAQLFGRCNAEGVLREDGDCLKVLCRGSCAAVGGHNSVTLRYRLRPRDGSFGGYTALTGGQEQVILGVLKTGSYELELSAMDALGTERTMRYDIPTAAVALHLAAGGTAVGLGKYAEHEQAVEIAPEWELWLRGKRLRDVLWPVGSIYLSTAATSPAELFGGSWEAIEDVFLLAAGDSHAAGETGGAAAVALTAAQLPASAWQSVQGMEAVETSTSGQSGAGYGMWTDAANWGQEHENMPPYLAVYMWRRTA